jgi:hypothetical protein
VSWEGGHGPPFCFRNNGYHDGPKQSYAPQNYATLNGFVGQPGTWFRGEDGRRHICQ